MEERVQRINEVAIDVENLNLNYSFFNSMNIKSEILKVFFRKKESRKKKIEALKNVSFQINKGEVIGIIGRNGAGKSTLLKVLANIYDPDSGNVSINENSIFLMSLGAGFQNELSAVDNIYLNALLLGLKKSEVEEKIDEIIEFAELEKFMHNPLKSFSSGMRSRLAFSIACNIKPDVLLIDEILSVGDEEFKIKSSRKIKELIKGNRTVILVSHNLKTIEELCDRVIWLHEGEVKKFDSSSTIIKEYKAFVKEKKEKLLR